MTSILLAPALAAAQTTTPLPDLNGTYFTATSVAEIHTGSAKLGTFYGGATGFEVTTPGLAVAVESVAGTATESTVLRATYGALSGYVLTNVAVSIGSTHVYWNDPNAADAASSSASTRVRGELGGVVVDSTRTFTGGTEQFGQYVDRLDWPVSAGSVTGDLSIQAVADLVAGSSAGVFVAIDVVEVQLTYAPVSSADAGVADSGPADLGSTDLGPADAGVADLGSFDSGTFDTGAGAADAGVDAGSSGTRSYLPVAFMYSEDHDSELYWASNANDGDPNTRFQLSQDNVWVGFELASAQTVAGIEISWYQGDQRSYTFVLSGAGTDGVFHDLLSAQSSGTTAGFETYLLPTPTEIVELQLTVRGSATEPVAITDILVFGPSVGGSDAGVVLPDAGTPDLGAPDFGTPDLGFADAGVSDGGSTDAGVTDGGTGGANPVPGSIFFVGNSFTLNHNVPEIVRQLITSNGFPEPEIGRRTVGGRSLEVHRADTTSLGAPTLIPRAGGWDALILQEFSTRPTDSIGPAAQFKTDAAWFYDLAKSVNPDTDVILYMTWARRYNHSYYPGTFTDPADMQAQLRYHYNDAANVAIPALSTSSRPNDARVAPVGDAWETQLAGGEPPRLHASDNYHQNEAGAYLNALMLYATLYRVQVSGSVAIGVTTAVANELQATVDGITGYTALAPGRLPPSPMAIGDTVAVDVGPTSATGWAGLTSISSATPVLTTTGTAAVTTSIWAQAEGFSGTQTGGTATNTLGLPTAVAQDSLWVGSTSGRATAVTRTATVTFNGVADGSYSLEIFASRAETSTGNRRWGEYTVGSVTGTYDAANNTTNTLRLDNLRPDAEGRLQLRVRVSPSHSTAWYAYVGALWLTRTGS